MEQESFLWLAGMLLLPLVAYCFATISILRDIKRSTDKLLEMHHAPDDHGFGTRQLTEIMRDLRAAMIEMAHYTRWTAENLTGKSPPPPLERPSAK